MLLETVAAIVSRFLGKDAPLDEGQNLPERTQRGSSHSQDSGQQTPTVVRQTNSRVYAYAANITPDGYQLSSVPTTLSEDAKAGMQILAEKRMAGAEVDSDARKYAPRCHPETRRTLRARIINWIEGKQTRYWRMLWVMGPAGVGKSAVAQTVAEEMKAQGQLGATLFFSRLNHRDDPSKIIPTLAYQLAVKHPQYKLIINRRLAEDPTIFEKTLRTQLKELIFEPFRTIMVRFPSTVIKPILVILDGLDECRCAEAQCEIIECIAEHVRSTDVFPIIWLICSRPEWHLKYLVTMPDFPTACRREELRIDDLEAQEDVALFLHAEFAKIRLRFRDYLSPSWPPADAVQLIVATASGLFALAGVVVRFIGDEAVGDPSAQLATCVTFLGGKSVPGAIHPLHALDLLYRQIWNNASSPTANVTARRILGAYILYSHTTPLSAQATANLLGLRQPEFYNSSKHLHSVLDIPGAAEALQQPVRFYHTSFGDYLIQPLRSREHSVDEGSVNYNVAKHAIELQKKWAIGEKGWGLSRTSPVSIHISFTAGLTWDATSEDESQNLLHTVRSFIYRAGWKACSKLEGQNAMDVVTLLDDFEFQIPVFGEFSHFVSWLYHLGPSKQSILHFRSSNCPAHHSFGAKIPIYAPSVDFEREIAPFGDKHSVSLHLGRGSRTREFAIKRNAGPTEPRISHEYPP
ncbi:hypothetical protein NP233_g5373 [Leucocoprinus birnbaumii]|uniref:NACHT domain-containing protein n=1 Tax=Leucocoprinus birnbaumii TaxID=56174 RepID=A0AAD5VWN5_9AGAR|nr:hypothetical protein NP233_g5373 [Leucocoprinus birnbaumii]